MSTHNAKEKILGITMEEFNELLSNHMPLKTMEVFIKEFKEHPIMFTALLRAAIEGPEDTITYWFALGFWMGYQKAKKEFEISELERMTR